MNKNLKLVVNNVSKEEIDSTQIENLSKGHYKVGNPYKINGIKYIKVKKVPIINNSNLFCVIH